MLRSHIPAKWMRAVCSLTVAGLLGLTACAAREPEIEAEKELLWKTAGFAVNGQAQEEQELWVEEYIPVAHSEVSADNNAYGDPRELGIYDMCAYRLYSYLSDSGDMSSWGLERCDLETGESSLTCLTPEALGLEDMEGSYLWNGCVMADGTPILRMWGNIDEEDEDWAMMLTREPPETADAVRIVSLAPETVGRVRAAAARVARKNPGCHFVYENRGNRDAEDYRTQIMTQIMTGDAPDILYVSLEDMKLLEQNDALMDLRTLLPQELLDQVLPGALGIGTVSGTLVSIPPEIDVHSMMVKDDVWPGDTWTVDDVLGLMETVRWGWEQAAPWRLRTVRGAPWTI